MATAPGEGTSTPINKQPSKGTDVLHEEYKRYGPSLIIHDYLVANRHVCLACIVGMMEIHLLTTVLES